VRSAAAVLLSLAVVMSVTMWDVGSRAVMQAVSTMVLAPLALSQHHPPRPAEARRVPGAGGRSDAASENGAQASEAESASETQLTPTESGSQPTYETQFDSPAESTIGERPLLSSLYTQPLR
jgi:hypothetical protein